MRTYVSHEVVWSRIKGDEEPDLVPRMATTGRRLGGEGEWED